MSIKQDLLEGIEFIVKNYIENAPFDKTRVGIIQGVSSNNAYTVKIDNRIFNNVPYLGNGTLGLNTTVRVVVPENQMNNIVILGTTQKEDAPIAVGVTSVNGKTGDVTLTKSDIGLSNLDNTSDELIKFFIIGTA